MGPTGGAGLGEVEDYEIFVGSDKPWTNPLLGEDVNGTGRVTTADLIILASFLFGIGVGACSSSATSRRRRVGRRLATA